jgi:hypothetical protein
MIIDLYIVFYQLVSNISKKNTTNNCDTNSFLVITELKTSLFVLHKQYSVWYSFWPETEYIKALVTLFLQNSPPHNKTTDLDNYFSIITNISRDFIINLNTRVPSVKCIQVLFAAYRSDLLHYCTAIWEPTAHQTCARAATVRSVPPADAPNALHCYTHYWHSHMI